MSAVFGPNVRFWHKADIKVVRQRGLSANPFGNLRLADLDRREIAAIPGRAPQ